MKFRKTFLFVSGLLVIVSLLSISTLLNGCKSYNGNTAAEDSLAYAKHLVQVHCAKCHALVPVNALTKDVWTVHTLPAMAHYFAIKTYGIDYYKADHDTSGISLKDWEAIVAYYKKQAPDTLKAARPPVALINDWAGFTLKKPDTVKDVAFTTVIAANKATNKIYTSDEVSLKLTEYTSQLKAKSSVNLPSTAVNIDFTKDRLGAQQAILSCIGRIDPVDFPNGQIIKTSLGNMHELRRLSSDLPRPVQTLMADFDKNGKPGIVVCGQGRLKGSVYLLKPNSHNTYDQTTITNRPGAVQAVTGDFNHDGWADLMVLFGSGDEGLTLFLNNQKGGFTSRDLLKFPPVNGSTSFQLADIDHDGNPDLIYTCGYNFHDSRIFKPYHGLYLYKNTGNFNFKQEWFYPINGCTKAIAADFKGDGSLDIATIAFFADMKNTPAEEFIYFEQSKAFSFKPHAVPVSDYGRWMCMDVADLNNDGKPDILLGNYANGFMIIPGLQPKWNKHLPFIVLENHIKK